MPDLLQRMILHEAHCEHCINQYLSPAFLSPAHMIIKHRVMTIQPIPPVPLRPLIYPTLETIRQSCPLCLTGKKKKQKNKTGFITYSLVSAHFLLSLCQSKECATFKPFTQAKNRQPCLMMHLLLYKKRCYAAQQISNLTVSPPFEHTCVCILSLHGEKSGTIA